KVGSNHPAATAQRGHAARRVVREPGPYPRWKLPSLVLDKPPWWSQNKDDIDAMVAWVNERLRVRFLERMNKLALELYEQGVEFNPEGLGTPPVHYSYEAAIDEARKGNVEPLRKHRPEIADLIHRPKRRRGERGFPRNLRLDWAVEDVKFIRQLWKREYG